MRAGLQAGGRGEAPRELEALMSFLPSGKCCSYEERTTIENLLPHKEIAHPFPHSHTRSQSSKPSSGITHGVTHSSPSPSIPFPNQKQDSEKTGSCPPKPLTTQLHIGLFVHAHPLTTNTHTQHTLTQFCLACMERALVWNPALDSGIPGFEPPWASVSPCINMWIGPDELRRHILILGVRDS